jgi:uncharacterized repeat protein (TIGR01451 family)
MIKRLPFRAARRLLLVAVFASSAVGRVGVPAQAGTPGIDGAKTITAANTIVNGYASLTSATQGSTTITVPINELANLSPGGLTPLGAGSVVLLYQANGALINDDDDTTAVGTTAGTAEQPTANGGYGDVTNGENAGYYEFTTVSSVNATTGVITISSNCSPLQHTYTTNSTQSAEIVRVPQYSSLTINGGSITALPWSSTENTTSGSATYGSTNATGAYGGIVAIDVSGTTTLAGTGAINVTGDGFLGGDGFMNSGYSAPQAAGMAHSHVQPITDTVFAGDTGGDNLTTLGAMKGESIAGNQATYDSTFGGRYGRGAPANGGGGGNGHNTGGGGGANGNNGNTWYGVGLLDTGYTNFYSNENGDNPTGSFDAGGFSANNTALPGTPMSVDSGGGRGGYSFGVPSHNPPIVPTNEGGFGGRPLGAVANSRVFFGGGGGAGDDNDSNGGNGGNGGGIVILNTGSVAGTGTILANGTAGGTPASSDGAGGGGAGGSVVVLAGSGSVAGITAAGGVGGNMSNGGTADDEGTGGGGGGGYIAAPVGAASVAGGGEGMLGTRAPFSSTYATPFPPFGATLGATGFVDAAPTSFTYCYTPVVGLAKQATTTKNNGDGTYNITYTVVAENYGDTPLTGATAQDVLANTFPTGTTYSIVTQPAIVANSATNGVTVTPSTNYDGTSATYLFTAGSFPVSNTGGTPTVSSVSLTFTVQIKPPAGSQTYNNTATTTATAPTSGYGNANGKTTTDMSQSGLNPDPAGNGNPAAENTPTPVTVTGQPMLMKTVQNITTGEAAGLTTDTAKPGNVLQYQLTFSNTTGGPLSNFALNDSIPTNTTYVAGSATCATNNTGLTCTPTYTAANGNTAAFVTFKLTGGTLPNYTGTGNQLVVTFRVTVN